MSTKKSDKVKRIKKLKEKMTKERKEDQRKIANEIKNLNDEGIVYRKFL